MLVTAFIVQPGKLIGLMVIILILQACVAVEKPAEEKLSITLTTENTGSFDARPAIPEPEKIHQLTPAQVSELLDYMTAPVNANVKPHKRLYQYMEQKTRDFKYERITLNATQAFALNTGNCMTLATLTTALAKAANIEIDYQLMDDIPVYELKGTLVEKGVHIRSILYDPDWISRSDVIFFSRPGIKIDYFPTNRQRFVANMDENDYLAMYYLNVATEALIDSDLNTAYWYAMESLNYVPDYSSAINLLAVINRRHGDLNTAEKLYLYGIEHADEKLSLMKNYHVLLSASGRIEEAEIIKQKLETMPDPSPFNWFQLARSAYDNGEYSEAIRYYSKAIQLAPYLHEAQLGIALANYKIGRLGNTERALKAAINNAYKTSTRNLYQAKLATLRAERLNKIK